MATYQNFIEFTTQVGCPVQCKFCPQSNFLNAYKGPRRLEYKDYTAMVDKVSPGAAISFAGFGEPFSHPECIDMIEYGSRKEGDAVIVYTTLQGVTPEIYKRLAGCKLNALIIHLPDTDGNTKVKFTPEYIATLEAMRYYQVPLGFHVHGRTIHPEVVKILGNIKVNYRMHDRAGNTPANPAILSVHWNTGKIICANGYGKHNAGNVMPNGDVYLCCMDWKLEYKLGNLLEQSWDELMRSETRLRCAKDRETGEFNTICRYCGEAVPEHLVR